METALVISYAQILEGDEMCEHCGEPAAVVLSTGADPEPEPMCWPAARQFVQGSVATMDAITGGSL